MAIKKTLIIIILTLSAAQGARAQTENSKNTIKLAEPFKIAFTINQSPPFTEVELKAKSLNLSVGDEGREPAPFAIMSVKPIETKDPAIGQFEIEVIPFELGITTFPVLTWILKNEQNETWQIETSSANFTVSQYTEKEDKDIKDIYPPIKFFSLWKALAILLIAAAIGAIIFFLIRKKKASSPEIMPFEDKKSPYQRAMNNIENLEKSGIWKEEKQKKFYIKLSDILRLYIMEDFSITAPLMTTHDLLKKPKSSNDDIELTVKTRQLLQFSDLMKFARLKASDKDKDRDIAAAKEIIKRFHSLRNPDEETEGGEIK